MRFTFFGGKGGVGKTTSAAAAAVRAAAEGARVLVVSTDPAHSLADALDTKLGPEPRRVARARGALFAAQLDADRALGRWLREREEAFRTIAERGTYLDEEDIDGLLSLSLPGVDELVGLVELRRLAGMRAWDEVVVDTAPTGHTLRLLEMPETLHRLAEVLDDMHAKHRFLATSLGGRWRPDFADETIGEVEREARELRSLLTDPARATFTWVTLLEELPLDETEEGVRALAALGVCVATIVANRTCPAPDRPCTLCSPRFVAETACRERLFRSFPEKRLLEVPAALAEPRGPRALLATASSAKEMHHGATQTGREKLESSVPPCLPGEPTRLPFRDATKLVLFGGKGGVGKTTAAAACAIEVARTEKNKQVLLLSTDPAHSLADALACELGDEPREVPGAPPNLVAREIDAKAAFETERERYRAAIDDLFASIFKGRMDAAFDRQVLEDLLDIAPPGIDELVALLSIIDALVAKRARWDLVVVDTAPTGHTLRLLELPPKALEWVHALMKVILKYRQVVGLGELASDLMDLARRLRAFIALLADPERCAFIAVARPAELPRRETERLVRALSELHVPLSAVVANAVTRGTCARCVTAAASEAAELRRLRKLGPTFLAPAAYPGPSGAEALLAWRARWTT